MAAIHELSAVEVAAQYASGALSPPEVTRACLERIAACEPRLNAMYRLDREGALAAAREAETRWRAKQPLSMRRRVNLVAVHAAVIADGRVFESLRRIDNPPARGLVTAGMGRRRPARQVVAGHANLRHLIRHS